MNKYLYQGPVSGITRRQSLVLLLSSTETGLLKDTKNCRKIGHLAKEARHMQHNLQHNPFLTTHMPRGGKKPNYSHETN